MHLQCVRGASVITLSAADRDTPPGKPELWPTHCENPLPAQAVCTLAVDSCCLYLPVYSPRAELTHHDVRCIGCSTGTIRTMYEKNVQRERSQLIVYIWKQRTIQRTHMRGNATTWTYIIGGRLRDVRLATLPSSPEIASVHRMGTYVRARGYGQGWRRAAT